MSLTLQQCIDLLDIEYGSAEISIGTVYSTLLEVADKLIAGDTFWAGWKLKDAAYYLRNVQRHIIAPDGENGGFYGYLLPYILNELQAGGVTYQQICEAWAANDFEGRAVTIAFIDRMRQLIWDEPYSAVWAAKPEEG